MTPPPSQLENDPVIATYSVYLTPSPPQEKQPRSLLIQYPDRKARRPYGPSTHQTPLTFRLKPNTGLVELDIPIDTAFNYNRARGATYADALHKSRITSTGGSHGLAGGFNAGPGGRMFRQNEDGDVDMDTIPLYGDSEQQQELKTQTLGGKIAKPSNGDPVYMLGSFQDSELHLTPLNSIVQVRPQLHHLDATDEVIRASIKPSKKGEQSEKPTGPETRAVELKVKTAEEKNADRARKRTNAEMLSDIQSEPWQSYRWHDTASPESTSEFSKALYHQHSFSSVTEPRPFISAISPTKYLDVISAPRIDPTARSFSHTVAYSRTRLGLMGKVRGRERERRRRKKNDASRRAAAAAEAEEVTRRATSEAVERGEMRAEDAEEIIRQASEEAAARADERENSTDDASDSSSGEEEDAEVAEVEEVDAALTNDVRPSNTAFSPSSARRKPAITKEPPDEGTVDASHRQQQAPLPKRGPGRPRKSDTGQVKVGSMVIDD